MHPRKVLPGYQDIALTRKGSFCDLGQVVGLKCHRLVCRTEERKKVGIGLESTNVHCVAGLCQKREDAGIWKLHSDAKMYRRLQWIQWRAYKTRNTWLFICTVKVVELVLSSI